MASIEERFWAKVDKSGGAQACWLWTSARYPKGYGIIRFDGKVRKAHRVSFFLHHGHWPEPCCCHRCDNPPCVNPAHLWEGSNADNTRDRDEKGHQRGPRGESHHKAKLSPEDVQSIRASDESHSVLARQYDVAHSTIQGIRNGRTWKHV